MSKQYKVYRETNYIRVIDTTTNELFNGTVKDVFVDKSNTQKNIYRLFNVKDLAEDTVFSIPDILKANGSAYSVSEWEAFYTENTGNFNGGGTAPTNLSYTPSPTQGTVTSDTGTDATIPLADGTNAGLLKPTKFTVLENTSGVNTGDQDLSGKANINSPSFTGTPTAPTATVGTNTTQIATTAFVAGGLAIKENAFSKNTAFNKNFGLNTGDIVGATTLLNQYSTTPVDWTATAFNSGQVVFYGGKQWIAKMATVAGDVPAVSSKWEEITFEALANKTVTVDQTIIDGSTNAVSGNAVFDGLDLKENEANKQNSLAIDGTGTKYPTVDAVNIGVILKDSSPQTKTGGFTSGGINKTYPNDVWLAFGTSVTATGYWTNPMATQLNTTLTNYGVGGSTSNDAVNHYSEVPTLNSGNENNYRLITIEYGINDAGTSVPLATFTANIISFINHIKGKNWSASKIMLVNSNYCSTVGLIASLPTYADEMIRIAKQEGVQYVDIYNYTKNNGGSTLLSDGIHPTVAGGKVYARGVIGSMYGGGEFSNSLSVVNKIRSGGLISDGAISLNGMFLQDVTYILPAGNSLFSKTINLTKTNNTSLYVNRYITNYNEDGVASSGGNENFTVRLNLNKSTNEPSGVYSALTINGNQNGTGTQGTFRNIFSSFTGTGTGSVSEVDLFSGLASNVTPSFSIGTYRGLDLRFSYLSGISNAYGVQVGDLFGSAISRGLELGVTSGAGKYNVYVSGAAPNYFSGSLLIGTTVSNGNAFRLVGAMELITPPTISAGGYDLLSRSLSTGVVERVPSTVFAPNILTGYVSGAGTVSATDTVLQAIQKLNGNDALKAPLASPSLTGTPTAPTAPAGTNTTQIATTAFVQATKPYKVYTALLSQSGTSAPVATVLENTLGGTVVWSREAAGFYNATLAGVFTLNKTTVLITQGDIQAIHSGYGDSLTNHVNLLSRSFAGMQIDNLLDRTTIEIRVYN